MIRLPYIVLLLSLALYGCSASRVEVKPNSSKVSVGSVPPGDGYQLIGPVTAKHGGGCGLYGAQGNFEGAMTILRNKAAAMGGDYVQIIRQEGEHMVGLCLDRAYVIDGLVFKAVDTRKKSAPTNAVYPLQQPQVIYR